MEIGQGRLELDPDFQRHYVWNEHQQARYVEFILKGGASSYTLYWNREDWNGENKKPFTIVDGKQRLEAVRKFMRNDLRVFGYLYNGGYLYSEFAGRLPLNARFNMNVNDLDRAGVLAWYIDLNAGGTAHTEEEIKKVRALLNPDKASDDALSYDDFCESPQCQECNVGMSLRSDCEWPEDPRLWLELRPYMHTPTKESIIIHAKHEQAPPPNFARTKYRHELSF